LNRDQKTQAKNEAGRIIVEEINKFLDGSNSPVSGGKFKSFKQDGGPSQLFETGDLRNSITYKRRKGSTIEVGVFSKREAPKAFNHNEGDTVPERKFIPAEGQKFKQSIRRRVDEAVKRIKEQEEIQEERKQTVQELFSAIDRLDLEIL